MDDAKSGAVTPHPLLHLATAPVNWNNNDIPGWRPLTPFPRVLDEMLAAGYGATEYDASFGRDDMVLRIEASRRGMTWCGSYQWVDFLDTDTINASIQALEPTLALLGAIGCRHLIVADSLRPHRVAMAGNVPADGSQSLTRPRVKRIADNVHRLAEAARHHDVAVHYHNHVGSWIETPAEVATLIDCLDFDAVDLCFDTGHYAYGGGDAASFIRDHHARIGYLHLKDVDPAVLAASRQEGLTFIEALKRIVFSPIGEGAADIPSILSVLTANGFAGWIVVEQDTCAGDATATARANLDFIARWLQRHTATMHTMEGGHIR